MRSLTPRQNAAVVSAQTRWLNWIFSTIPASREQAEEAVRHTYRAGGVPEPEIFLWFDDLIEAMLVTESSVVTGNSTGNCHPNPCSAAKKCSTASATSLAWARGNKWWRR
jgi:hypothetical protein